MQDGLIQVTVAYHGSVGKELSQDNDDAKIQASGKTIKLKLIEHNEVKIHGITAEIQYVKGHDIVIIFLIAIL